ncbi:MAG: hypothetical protein V8T87_03495 [Victivallales bacterium]
MVIFAVMTVLCLVKLGCAITFESEPANALHGLPVAAASNLEGKELRLGAGRQPPVGCIHDMHQQRIR